MAYNFARFSYFYFSCFLFIEKKKLSPSFRQITRLRICGKQRSNKHVDRHVIDAYQLEVSILYFVGSLTFVGYN